jgi:hypothetical protein
MSKVRALRGVCVGVNRHLQPGDVDDLDAASVSFLVAIGAVERYVDPAPAVKPEPAPAVAGKKEK